MRTFLEEKETPTPMAPSSPTSSWEALYNEFSLHMGYELLSSFYRSAYQMDRFAYRYRLWRHQPTPLPELRVPPLKPHRLWKHFWAEFRNYLLKKTNHVMGRYILPILETVAKWQIASWLVVSMVTAGFSLPFIGLKPMLFIAGGVSVGLGYHQYIKILADERREEDQRRHHEQLEIMTKRIDNLEKRVNECPVTAPPSLLHHYPQYQSRSGDAIPTSLATLVNGHQDENVTSRKLKN